MKDDGLVVRSRAVREMDQDLCKADLDKLRSTPHDPLGTIRSATTSARPPVVPREAGEDEMEYRPQRARITKEVIEKFGKTVGCPKCRALDQ